MFFKAKHIRLVMALGVTTLCVVASCKPKQREGEEMIRESASSPESLLVQVQLNEGGYAIGEPIEMKLIVTNLTSRALRLFFPTAQRYDFIVSKGNEVLWRWSDARTFAQVTSTLLLEPRATITYEATWDQTTRSGVKLPLGRYAIKGVLTTRPSIDTEPKVFGIVD